MLGELLRTIQRQLGDRPVGEAARAIRLLPHESFFLARRLYPNMQGHGGAVMGANFVDVLWRVSGISHDGSPRRLRRGSLICVALR